jgi:hypothetical protein
MQKPFHGTGWKLRKGMKENNDSQKACFKGASKLSLQEKV